MGFLAFARILQILGFLLMAAVTAGILVTLRDFLSFAIAAVAVGVFWWLTQDQIHTIAKQQEKAEREQEARK